MLSLTRILKSTNVIVMGALALVAASTTAHADVELNAIGAVSFLEGAAHSGLTTVSPMLGASLLFGTIPTISLGPVYENNFVFNHGQTGHRSYFGALARFHVGSIVFVDGTIGGTSINTGSGSTSDLALGGGADIGIHMLPFIYPFVGYRYTPTKWGASSTDGNIIDLGIMISIGH